MSISSVHHALPNLAFFKPSPARRRLTNTTTRCCATQQLRDDVTRVTVKQGNDSLDISRVLNGMWQTSGGWGKIDRDDAVYAMLKYADSGLSTFDMADHCKLSTWLIAYCEL
ncbi:hypothetical protein ACFE04_030901 [Oxalis oulophora]